MILQGEGRPEQAERFVQKLNEAGVSAEILPALDKTHLEINREFGQPDDEVTRAVFTFLSEVLQSTP